MNYPQRIHQTQRAFLLYWPSCDWSMYYHLRSRSRAWHNILDPSLHRINRQPFPRAILDNAEINAPDDEVEWRNSSPAWSVRDLFEALGDQFRNLKYVPVKSDLVHRAGYWTCT
ncbi:hypothetical protein BDZ85DRAFT_18359 [Elsinoe ampelina]|uniref:Uncharacterized protein n=1 Tax=Elsinoe ampelina TaxID=302913 RepID=A0A6A6G7K5_9PEZI|nr:hypothetical protein BDZ85DRAFT_18359 [Elsinoe ampelina]